MKTVDILSILLLYLSFPQTRRTEYVLRVRVIQAVGLSQDTPHMALSLPPRPLDAPFSCAMSDL